MVKPRLSFHGNVRPGLKLYVMRWTNSNKLGGFGIRALRHRFEVKWW